MISVSTSGTSATSATYDSQDQSWWDYDAQLTFGSAESAGGKDFLVTDRSLFNNAIDRLFKA